MLKTLKIWYLRRKMKKPCVYTINGFTFVLDKITVKQYAELVKLIDAIFTEQSGEPGMAGLVASVILKFEKLAAIIFAGQPHAALMDWNEIDGNLAYQITADVLKKNPNLMMHLKSIINSFGLNAGQLAAALKKFMQSK